MDIMCTRTPWDGSTPPRSHRVETVRAKPEPEDEKLAASPVEEQTTKAA